MTLPRYKKTDTSKLTPIPSNLFEVWTKPEIVNLQNSVMSYRLDVDGKKLTLDLELNVEILHELLNELWSIESIEIVNHLPNGKIVISTSLESLQIPSAVSLEGSYENFKPLRGKICFPFGAIFQSFNEAEI